jgi:nucleoside-diphosphate-sugar epimerase
LAEELARRGAGVRALVRYGSRGGSGWLDDLPGDLSPRLEIRAGDVRDAGFVRELCDGVEVVFHLAALIGIPYSYVAPESYLDTNVRGTLNVLEAARAAGCARLIHASTSEVYGNPSTLPITEAHPLRGQSPYSASKIAADKLCEAYHCSFATPVVVLRPFNTFGPRQSGRAVIPTIVAQALAGSRLALGSLTPRRDFTYVTDTVEGFLAAAVADDVEGRTIHLGTGRAVSVGELVAIVARCLGVDLLPETRPERVRPESSEIHVLESDPALARALLRWSPAVSLEEGVARTAEWIRAHAGAVRHEAYQV